MIDPEAGPAHSLAPDEAADSRRAIEARAAWQAVSSAFGSLGRAFMCANADFRVIHGSYVLDQIAGPGTAPLVEGRQLQEILGEDLFGPSGTLRLALESGERREGWRAELRVGRREGVVVSLSAAPFPAEFETYCDPNIRFVIVLRPADQDRDAGMGAPTSMGGLTARSPAMLRIFSLVDDLRHTEATVLITGESGTGKEILARAIHDRSPRRTGPFVAVNCGALPADLLEAEMFGHVRGAFTGAVRDRVGRFELASNGTMFLDEVGDLPLSIQVKLLRVLQDGTFERLGENKTRTSHARVIAATHVDLSAAVRERRFRDDLYYRLRVLPLEVPALRERREDIEPLARTLLARVGSRHGRALQFSPDALRALLHHSWPGNVRELENVLEYAVTVARGQTLLPEDLPELGLAHPARTSGHPVPVDTQDDQRRARPGRWRATPGSVLELERVLDAHRWNRADAARALGISRITLWRRMREAGLAG
jgi:DNA-binding NtrC family response regulator